MSISLIIRYIAFTVVMFATSFSFAGKTTGPILSVDTTVIDLGDIKPDRKIQAVFTITNTGDEPLIIHKIVVQCGCTTPKWEDQPISPGDTSQIYILFDPEGKYGKQRKVVRIVSNAGTPVNLVVLANIL